MAHTDIMKRSYNRIIIIAAILAVLPFLYFQFQSWLATNEIAVDTNRRTSQNDAFKTSNAATDIPHTPINQTNTEHKQMNVRANSGGRALIQRSLLGVNMHIVRQNLDRTYATLFAQLKLAPEEIELIKDLMAEHRLSKDIAELQEGSFKQDMRTREKVKILAGRTEQEIANNIADLLGTERYETFVYYQNTLQQREEVEKIEHMFSYQAEPLTSDQKELLIDVFHGQASLMQQGEKSTARPDGNPQNRPVNQYKADILKQTIPFLTESQIQPLTKYLDSK